jgi:hypothetical protein
VTSVVAGKKAGGFLSNGKTKAEVEAYKIFQ